MENSLKESKGSSIEIEKKNKVRTMLKEIFPERDCFTMVRPLESESDLQNLQSMEFSKLRPEFFNQVLELRKKILKKGKIKKIGNKILNGELYVELIRSYVYAINSGIVPNIENTWISICEKESDKAYLYAKNYFSQCLENQIISKLPIENQKIKVRLFYLIRKLLNFY